MATCLHSRTKSILFQNPRFIPSLFSEKWFSISIVGDLGLKKNGLRDSVSLSDSADKLVVTDTPFHILDEKHKQLQYQSISYRGKNCQDLFKSWGCNNEEISQILSRMPSLHKAKLDKLESKLKILQDLGFKSSDLVKIISCRPRFLRCRISHGLSERVNYLQNLFGSKETLQKAILRNPSFLTYDLKSMVIPTVELNKSMGISGDDLTLMILSRPTLITRTSLSPEKMDYIRKTGITKDSKLYKYVVTLMAISRPQTIREKVENLEKFGFSEDEVFRLLGRSPLVLTLSVDKVQRNMTFVVACMKLPAKVVLNHPFLLFGNLESLIKPRMILAGKIDEMGLVPRIEGLKIFTALRMTEKRFVKAFIDCHPPETAKELMECFADAKHVKRLAEESKTISHKWFPF